MRWPRHARWRGTRSYQQAISAANPCKSQGKFASIPTRRSVCSSWIERTFRPTRTTRKVSRPWPGLALRDRKLMPITLDMGALLSKLMGVLSGQGGAATQTLRQAQQERTKVSLEVTSGKRAVLMVTHIEQVRDDDLIVSQPTVGGQHHPLAFGEDLRLSLVVNGEYFAGRTRCLGRIKIPGGAPAANGAEPMIHAYRLELPTLMGNDNRRRFPRVLLRFER